MFILQLKGWSLEKTLPNSFEDFFNKSEVIYEEDGEERKFTLTYLQYFEEKLDQLTSYEQSVSDRTFKDIAALASLLNHPELKLRKRLFISDETAFIRLFEGFDFKQISNIIETMMQNK